MQQQREVFQVEDHPDQSEGSDHRGAKVAIEDVEAHLRRGFVRKVYGILTSQLMITVAIGCAVYYFNYRTKWFGSTDLFLYVFYGSTLGTLVVMLGMACCCPAAARKYPTNYVLLFSFTVLEAISVGCVCCVFRGPVLLLAAASTVLVFASLTAYACCTKTDFTGMGPYLYALLMCMIMFGIVLMACNHFAQASMPEGAHQLYALMGIVLFSFYIVYDTQLIIGGKHSKYKFDLDDYCFAALNLYIDIIQMFLYILRLLGDR